VVNVLQARIEVKSMQRGWQEDFASAPILFRLLHATPTPGRLEIEPPNRPAWASSAEWDCARMES